MRKNRPPTRRPRWYDALVFAALMWAYFAVALAVQATVQEGWGQETTVIDDTAKAGSLVCTVDEDTASGIVACPAVAR